MAEQDERVRHGSDRSCALGTTGRRTPGYSTRRREGGRHRAGHDETTDNGATAARLRYLVEGVPLRLAALGDSLGGYACTVVEADGHPS